jgi:hypothetical protein
VPTIGDILLEFLLPALIVAAGFFFGFKLGRWGQWLFTVACAAGFALADCRIAGTPRWPPGNGDVSYWIIWFSIPLAALGILDSLLRPPLFVRALVILMLARLAIRALLAPVEPKDIELIVDALSLVATVWWLAMESLAQRRPGMTMPLVLFLTFAGAAGLLALSNNIKPSQAAATLAAMSAGISIVAWIMPQLSLAQGPILVLGVPLLALLVLVHFYYYTEPPLASVVLLLTAPLFAWLGEWDAILRLRPAWRWLIRLTPVVLALALAAGWCVRQNMADSAAKAAQNSSPGDF